MPALGKPRRIDLGVCSAGLLALAMVSAACSSSQGGANRRGNPDSGNTTGGSSGTGGFTSFGFPDSGTDAGGDGAPSTVIAVPDGGTILSLDGTGGGFLKLVCETGMLVVSGTPKTVQCWVELSDGTRASNVVWLTDDTRVGSIGSDGVFRASGYSGGVVKITATVGTTGVVIGTTITVDVAIQNNSGGLSPAEISTLITGGSADSQFGWLYPFDKTVFPRGLQPPELQFQSGCTADGTYLKITLPHFLYEQATRGGTPLRITIPDAVWKGLTLSTAGSDLVNVTVSKACGAQVAGPVSEQWLIAPGKLKGVVYYTRYVKDTLATSGAMRLPLGSQAELFLGDCHVCHSVSANGEVMATGIDWSGSVLASATYNLTTGTAPPPEIVRGGDPAMFTFPGLTPDGKRALTWGTKPGSLGVRAQAKGVTRLVDTFTGQVITTPSLTVQYAQSPSFSPDGKYVAFNNTDVGETHLAVMDYDGTLNPPAFSNLRDVAVHATKPLTWPSFLPDSLGVVYQESNKFETTWPSELRLVELGNQEIKPLGALNGYLPDGTVYLPGGATGDVNTGQGDDWKDYEPTVMPRPIGGYFWVMFASRRIYGNTIGPGGTATPTDQWNAWSMVRKKIWVAAVDIDHPTKPDPSHPAFYLPGQEIDYASLHPFVSLDPCRPLGATCESGADCCDGFCRETGRQPDGTPILECVPPPPGGCSQIDEVCVTPADCCDPTLLCIVNRCAIPTPAIY